MFSLCLFGPVISLSLHFLRSKMKLTRCQLQGLDMRFQEDKYRAGKFPFFHGLAQCRFYKGSSWRPWISLFPPYQLAYPQPEQSGPSWPSPEAVFTITTPHALQKRGAKEMQQRGLSGAFAGLLAGNSQSLELKYKAAQGWMRQLNPEGAWVWRKMEEDKVGWGRKEQYLSPEAPHSPQEKCF